jgi:hypothetical protein
MSLSSLEAQFPRVASELVQRWSGPDVDAYLDQLISHTREGREGFPLEVMSDLLFLSELYWWLTHSNASEAALSGERFSFGGPAKTLKP